MDYSGSPQDLGLRDFVAFGEHVSANLDASAVSRAALPGARAALILLLTINLFNYIDRQVLAAVVEDIEKELPMPAIPQWLQRGFGSDL